MANKLLELLLGKSSEKGMTLAEMERPPRIVRTGDRVAITVWNSMEHSSLAVKKLDHRRDVDAVVLRAIQALVTEVGDSKVFSFTAAELGLDAGATRFVWADPDGKLHPLAVDAPAD